MATSSMSPVIAGVSGSAASHRAIEAAAVEADALGRPLHLVHAFSWPSDLTAGRAASTDLLRQATTIAGHVVPGLRITAGLLEGNPVIGLLRLSRLAELTVIGDGDLNGRTCLPRDATAVQVAARASSNVMVTRAAAPPDGPVLVGVDGATSSEQALALAFDEATRRGCALIVVHVGEDGRRERMLADRIAAHGLERGADVRFHFSKGDPAEVLRAEARHAALTIVGARGELPYHGLLGSVAQTLLHHGRGPVVVVHGTRLPHPRECRVDLRPEAAEDEREPTAPGSGRNQR